MPTSSNVAALDHFVEDSLRDQHRPAVVKHIGCAASPHFLRRGHSIEAIDKKRETEGFRLFVAQRDEAVLRVQNLLQRTVNPNKQFVEVGRDVQRVDHLGDYLPLYFGALPIRDLRRRRDNGLHGGVVQEVRHGAFYVMPGIIPATDSNMEQGFRSGLFQQLGEQLARGFEFFGVNEVKGLRSAQFLVRIAKQPRNGGVGIEQRSFRGHQGEQVGAALDQRPVVRLVPDGRNPAFLSPRSSARQTFARHSDDARNFSRGGSHRFQVSLKTPAIPAALKFLRGPFESVVVGN